jgi:hypothetical protein
VTPKDPGCGFKNKQYAQAARTHLHQASEERPHAAAGSMLHKPFVRESPHLRRAAGGSASDYSNLRPV